MNKEPLSSTTDLPTLFTVTTTQSYKIELVNFNKVLGSQYMMNKGKSDGELKSFKTLKKLFPC